MNRNGLLLLPLLLCSFLFADHIYLDAEDGSTQGWSIVEGSLEGARVENLYDKEIASRVIYLENGGIYELGGTGDEGSWNNTQDRMLSWRMKFDDAYTIYVSVTTTNGHRWLFYNDLNVHVGHHGTGILNGFGGAQTHNGTWQTVTVDLERELKDTEPNNEILTVNGIRFGGSGGYVDNIRLYTPTHTLYENGEMGTEAWSIIDNDPTKANVSVVYDNETVLLRGDVSDPDLVPPLEYAYNDNVIALMGDGEKSAYRLGDISGERAWNNTKESLLQWKMRNDDSFTVRVHVETTNGSRTLIYTPQTRDLGMSDDGLEIHHGLGISRNGDDVPYGEGTDNRWLTYTRNLRDDLHDYEPDNQLIAVNGMTVEGSTLIDDVMLLSSPMEDYTYSTYQQYFDGEDGSLGGWHMRDDSEINGRINNLFDSAIGSRVIEFTGGESYSIGANTEEPEAWNNQKSRMISWRMKTLSDAQIIVHVNTTFGLRHLFYTTMSYNRALYHSFEGGIHHGIAGSADGRWRTITRDLERDLKDADPTNELLSVDGMTINGGDGMRLDDLLLYSPIETYYMNGNEVNGWSISDNDPLGATIKVIEDSDLQGRSLQGKVISLEGSGVQNAYLFAPIENHTQKILQWRFRNFGDEPIVLSADPDERGTIRDPDAFAFRVHLKTTKGDRDLLYTLGEFHEGIIENGQTIHHGLGDDRTIGSIWAGDEPIRLNEKGLWQGVTRNLVEDLKDFEPDNELISVESFEVRNSGLIDDIKMLNSAILYEPYTQDPITVYEDAEDGTIQGWSIFANDPEGATIRNVKDPQRNGLVIELNGTGLSNGYMLGERTGEGAWEEYDKKVLRWSMKYAESFTIYISAETTLGRRYFTYTPIDEDRGLSNGYILLGLGSTSANGTWQTFTRDLVEDLHRFEPDNHLISINAFMIRGSGRIDDIQTLISKDIPITQNILYEDAEDGTTQGWSIFADDPEGATISNVEDNRTGGRVIALSGTGKSNGYMLGERTGEGAWNNEQNRAIRWSMNYAEDFTIYISAETTLGRRYFTYTPIDEDRGLSGQYILLGLGSSRMDGTWQNVTRDLVDDLHRFEPDNDLVSVNAFLIRGSGWVDDIMMYN